VGSKLEKNNPGRIVFEHLGVHFGAFGTFLDAILEPLGSLWVTKTLFGGVLGALA
jgi:hypothetical protein